MDSENYTQEEIAAIVKYQKEGKWYHDKANLNISIASFDSYDREKALWKAREAQTMSSYFYRKARLVMGCADNLDAGTSADYCSQ